MSEDKSLDDVVEKSNPSVKKIAAVDTGATVAYSLIAGTCLDCAAGLNLTGVLVSRAMGTASNTATGGLYGWWREKVYDFTKTDEKSGKTRKFLTELLAFNSCRVPTYYAALCISSHISEGAVNFEKAQNGAMYLAAISPIFGPTLGLFIDSARRIFKIKPADEGAYRRNAPEEAKE